MKNTVKKITAVLLITSITTVTLAGCSGRNDVNDSTNASVDVVLTSETDINETVAMKSGSIESVDSFGSTEDTTENEDSGFIYTINDDKSTITIEGTRNNEGELSIPQTIGEYTVTTIGNYAFFKNAITEIHLPESIESIGEAAFFGCYNLNTISFENLTSLAVIGDYSFANCENLKSVIISQPNISIGNYAFSNCFNLSDITIPDLTVPVGKLAFFGCSGSPIDYSEIERNTKNTREIEVSDGYDYSDWVTVSSIESETPMETTSDDTTRTVSNGYRFAYDENNSTEIIYSYLVQEREKTPKFKTITVTTYNYVVLTEKDSRIVETKHYNQSTFPQGALPII